VHRFGGTSPNWEIVATYAMIGGIVGALLAAVPGLIDVMSLPSSVQRLGFAHMGINLAVVVLYVINAWMRRDGTTDGLIWLSVISVALLGVSGWLGGEMVYARGVAVDPAAVDGHGYAGADRRNPRARSGYVGPERRMAA